VGYAAAGNAGMLPATVGGGGTLQDSSFYILSISDPLVIACMHERINN
jgi:hypothetical protein